MRRPLLAATIIGTLAMPAISHAQDAHDSDAAGGILLLLALAVAAILLLLVPWFIARKRGVATRGWLLLVDVLFGWSVLGWFVCLLWAVLGETEDVVSIRERQLRQERE